MPSNSDRNSNKPSLCKQKLDTGTIIKVVVVSVLVIALLGYLAWDIIANGSLSRLLSNRDQLVELMHGMGLWAPFFYILLQVLQTVVAPIPGQIVGGVGGFLFGHWGILWTAIGSFIGFWLVFKIARRFGRPLLEKIFKKSAVDKFDFIINAKGAALILFAIFLLPGFPDDIVCYIAGLTKIPIKRLMIIAILGRLPTIVVTNFIGVGLGDNNIGMVAAFSIIGVIILGIFTWKREAIIKFMKRDSKEESDNEKSEKSEAESKSQKTLPAKSSQKTTKESNEKVDSKTKAKTNSKPESAKD